MIEQAVCEMKHLRVDERLTGHDNDIKENCSRIDKLENSTTRTEVVVENLCNQIQSLVSIIKWFLCMLIVSLVGFLFWYIQTH